MLQPRPAGHAPSSQLRTGRADVPAVPVALASYHQDQIVDQMTGSASPHRTSESFGSFVSCCHRLTSSAGSSSTWTACGPRWTPSSRCRPRRRRNWTPCCPRSSTGRSRGNCRLPGRWSMETAPFKDYSERPGIQEWRFDHAAAFLDALRASQTWWTLQPGQSCRWVFRGQSDANWKLLPRAFRPDGQQELAHIYSQVRSTAEALFRQRLNPSRRVMSSSKSGILHFTF